MPLYLRGQLILLWICSFWFCIKTVQSDALPYGERIRPLKGTVTKVKLVACETCYNKTTITTNNNTNNGDEQSTKIAYKRLGTSIRREDAGPITKSNPLRVQNVNPLEKTQQTASPIYSGIPKENIKNRGATFFFTQVEPHRYEYRAMFQHHRSNFQQTEVFNPFVQNFDPFTRDFPTLPKFPTFGEFPQIFPDHKDPFPNFPDHKDPFPNLQDHKDLFRNFPDHKDPFPNFPDHKDPFRNFPEITFPTLSPIIKRAWEPDTEVHTQRPVLEKDLDGPLVKKYDVVLGHHQYPKIFRFNDERINIEEFDREKKLRLYKLSKSGQNEILEPENVKRDQLLILHGGIFTVKEPPLFNKRIRKIRKNHIFGSKVS